MHESKQRKHTMDPYEGHQTLHSKNLKSIMLYDSYNVTLLKTKHSLYIALRIISLRIIKFL